MLPSRRFFPLHDLAARLAAGLGCLLFPLLAPAQIELGTGYFPRVGDTLQLMTDGLPGNIDLGAPGADRTWDFRSLTAPFREQQVVADPSEGDGAALFPEAEQVLGPGDAVEAYYRVDGGSYQLLGFHGDDPFGLGFLTGLPFRQPYAERYAPLRYLDVHAAETSIAFGLALDELPEGVVPELPVGIDSLRLVGVLSRADTVDAWGTVLLPEGDYPVLREKRVETNDLRIEAKLPILGWADVTELFIALLPDADLLGPVRTTSYVYWSDRAREPIAEVLTDSAGITAQRVTYKADGMTTTLRRVARGRPDVIAFPNPAISDVRFAFSDLPAGQYTLSLYNILGVTQWKQTYFVDGGRTERISVGDLPKGSYLYSLADERGRTLVTKRLIVLKP